MSFPRPKYSQNGLNYLITGLRGAEFSPGFRAGRRWATAGRRLGFCSRLSGRPLTQRRYGA